MKKPKVKTTNKLTKRKHNPGGKNRTLTAIVAVDAPSGEGKQMQARTVFAHRALLEALEANRGNIKKACEAVGITRQSYYEYLKDPDFAQAVDNIKQGITDDYIEALATIALDAKFFPAVKYYLDNHAQDRGFGKELQPKEIPTSTTNVQINLSSLPVETLKQLKEAIKQTTKDES